MSTTISPIKAIIEMISLVRCFIPITFISVSVWLNCISWIGSTTQTKAKLSLSPPPPPHTHKSRSLRFTSLFCLDDLYLLNHALLTVYPFVFNTISPHLASSSSSICTHGLCFKWRLRPHFLLEFSSVVDVDLKTLHVGCAWQSREKRPKYSHIYRYRYISQKSLFSLAIDKPCPFIDIVFDIHFPLLLLLLHNFSTIS